MILGIRDLRYYLIDSEADWTGSFQIIDQQRRLWNDREIILYALGTSHAVTILRPGQWVTELLSCSGSLNLGRSIAEAAACVPFEFSTCIHDLRYRFRLTLHDLRGNDMLRGQFAPENEIAIAFPKADPLPTPTTRIGWRIEARALHIETLHTYPEDAGAVRSESVFEIA
jgi:hypothetical protein